MIQLDFGNLAVGIGTFCVALVSLRSVRNTEKQLLEEKRRLWKQEACQLCATFFSLCYDLSRSRKVALGNDPGSPLSSDEQRIYTKIKQFKIQIYFLFNVEKHTELFDELDSILNKAFKGETIPEKAFLQKARCFLDRTVF